MKRILAIFLLFLLLFPLATVAEDTAPASQKENATENQHKDNKDDKDKKDENGKNATLDDQLQINWQQMNEMQIALIMINRQIDYLMGQIRDNDDRVIEVVNDYEKRIDKERERMQENIAQLNQKLAEKEQELEEARNEIVSLHKKMAIFNSENSVYLTTLLGFLAGIIVGIIGSSFLSFLNRKKQSV